MRNEHTPGRWSVGSSDGPDIGIIARDSGRGGQMVAMAVVDEDCAQGTDEHRANARLIAASPDLLAALRECITSEGAACFGDMKNHPEWMQRRLYAIADIARDAIAKATGGAQ